MFPKINIFAVKVSRFQDGQACPRARAMVIQRDLGTVQAVLVEVLIVYVKDCPRRYSAKAATQVVECIARRLT